MKISIPILDKYIDACNKTGVSPLFENYKTQEDSVQEIDPILFEAYRDYKNESRLINLFEYQAIKSYAQFLEDVDSGEEDEESPEHEAGETAGEEKGEHSEGGEEPAEEPAEVPAEEPSEEPAEEPTEEPIEDDDEDDEDSDDEDSDDEEPTEESVEVKTADHGPEKNAKIEELPATDDEFGIEIDIEQIGKDIDKSFQDIEDEILSLGEPETADDKAAVELIGEESDVNEAADENNLIIDFIFRRPKIKKIMKKSLDLKLKAITAETKVTEIMAKKNADLDKKLQQLKSKNVPSDKISKLRSDGKQKLKDFEATLDKRTEAADDAVKEIDSQADEIATSNYLKKLLVKERIERELEVAKAKMANADESEQADLKTRIKDSNDRLKEIDDELNTEEGKAASKKKELGLSDPDFKQIEDANLELDKLKDMVAVLRKKGDDPEAKKELANMDGIKFKIWLDISKVLDKVKDKDKKASMYHTLTGNQNINNGAELEDYTKSNGVTPNREKLESAVEAAQTAYDEIKDGEDKAAILDAKIKLISAKLSLAKEDKNEDQITTLTDELTTAQEEKKNATAPPVDPIKAFLDSEEGKGFSTTKPSDEELDQYETKTVKDAEDNDVTLYKKKSTTGAAADPAKTQKLKEIEQSIATATKKLEGAKSNLEKKKADPSTDPKAISAIEANVKGLEDELARLNSEKTKLGESSDVFEYELGELHKNIDSLILQIENIGISFNTRVYENLTVAQKFRQALK